MWPRVWQVAGRVDQIPEPGDYVTYEIGRESVIAVRGLDGASGSSTTCVSTAGTGW